MVFLRSYKVKGQVSQFWVRQNCTFCPQNYNKVIFYQYLLFSIQVKLYHCIWVELCNLMRRHSTFHACCHGNRFLLKIIFSKAHKSKSRKDINKSPIKLQSIIKPTFVPILVVIDLSKVKKKMGGGHISNLPKIAKKSIGQ